MRVKEAQFRIKYEGEDDGYHQLDAALLSQALMAFSEMGRIAYREMNPLETHTLEVKVQALEAGSFEIALETVVPAIEHIYEQVVGLFNRSDVQAAATAVGIGGVIAKAFGLIKRIGGRKHKAEKDGDRTIVITPDGDKINVSTAVYNIAGNATFIKAAGDAMAPLDDPQYDRMSIKDTKGNTLDTTHEDERGYFKLESDELESEETLVIEVAIETVQIDSPNRVWRFRSGDQSFNAKVMDTDFLNFVKNHGYKIYGETTAKVERREVRKRDKTGKSTSKYYIEKVIRIENPGETPKLF